MGHIFISYSREDKDYVMKLVETLETRGFDVWHDLEMYTGDEWYEHITTRIDTCEAFIVVMSRSSKSSKWVEREVLYALQINKKIFPLLLQGDLWMLLQDKNYANVKGGILPDERFFHRLREHLDREANQKTALQIAETRTSPILNQYGFRIAGIIFAFLLLVLFGENYLVKNLSSSSTDTLETVHVTPTKINIPAATSTLTLKPLTITPIPTLGIGSTSISEKDGMTLIYIPVGEFTMGSGADVVFLECQKYELYCRFTDEEPSHKVNLASFWIDQTEVTNAMYAKCVVNGDCTSPSSSSSYTYENYYGNSKFDDYPVIYVNWNQANAYCKWVGRQLPTEAQWEKAARGTDGRVYPWGNTFDGTIVNFCDTNCSFEWANKSFDDGYADVAPVGNYPAGKSIFGALDMAGNVWEWVSSLYQDYPYNANDGREDLTASGSRVLRGGAWRYPADGVRSFNREGNVSSYNNFGVGFRCALDANP